MGNARPFAIVTGASTGIGYELAKCCAENGFDLLIAADEPEIENAARTLGALGTSVQALQVDLSTIDGVDTLCAAARGRKVGALLANAGRGLGKGFLDQNWDDVRHVIDTNITGTVYLLHRIGRDMRGMGEGRILITSSIAGFMPGTFQAVHNASKAFLDTFAEAIRNEMKDTGITVTSLMPGATETDFFKRADLMDTGQEKKMDAADVARQGYEAMMNGEERIITGFKNKMQLAVSRALPSTAEPRRKETGPGSAAKVAK